MKTIKKESIIKQSVSYALSNPKNLGVIVLIDVVLLVMIFYLSKLVQVILPSFKAIAQGSMGLAVILLLLYYTFLFLLWVGAKYFVLMMMVSIGMKNAKIGPFVEFAILNLRLFAGLLAAAIVLILISIASKESAAPFVFLAIGIPLSSIWFVWMESSHGLFGTGVANASRKGWSYVFSSWKEYWMIPAVSLGIIFGMWALFAMLGLGLRVLPFSPAQMYGAVNAYQILASITISVAFYVNVLLHRIGFLLLARMNHDVA